MIVISFHFQIFRGILAICLLLILGAFSHVSAQKIKASALPPKVSSSFSEQFPNSLRSKWEKTGVGYKVDFSFEQEKLSAHLDLDGKLLSTEKVISRSSLPFEVAERVEKDFTEWEIAEVVLVESPQSEITKRYRLKLKKGKDVVKATFLPNGTLLS